jgi:hypothetical protein
MYEYIQRNWEFGAGSLTLRIFGGGGDPNPLGTPLLSATLTSFFYLDLFNSVAKGNFFGKKK